ncbi:MAG: hypothetical protein CFE37_13395 [Alphaproteobacteria bacterium PA4]|nr:MAG: hypothetical protein CFE37_13395 [Alphaproteobacteria bacterium PA4]
MSDYDAGAAASRAARQGQMLRPQQLDDLGATVLLLARELWVVKDRQRVLEALLADHGIIAPGAVADHQPGPALAAELDAERARYTRALMETLSPPEEKG